MSEPLIAPEPVDAFERGYNAIREGCGLLEASDQAVLILTGEDRKGWLQGQVTNDLHHVHPGSSIAFCLCSPTGQIEAICTLWAFPDRFVVTTPAIAATAVLERVRRMVISEDVVAQRSDATLVSIQGPLTTQELGKLFDLPNLDTGIAHFEGQPVSLLRSNRAGSGGWDLLVDPGHAKALKKLAKTFEGIDAEAYFVARLEAGIPLMGVDTDAKTLPPELGPHFDAGHVSYKKGCYTGQEVLMRINSRGHTNRTWMALASERHLTAGDSLSHASRPDAGIVTSAAFSPEFGYIAGAMLRNEAASKGEAVTVHNVAGDVQARVYQMPLLRLM